MSLKQPCILGDSNTRAFGKLSNVYDELERETSVIGKQSKPKNDSEVTPIASAKRKRGNGAVNGCKSNSEALTSTMTIHNKPDRHSASSPTNRQQNKKRRFAWTDELHALFMAAIFDIGLSHAKPKAIVDIMHRSSDSPDVQHVKSHLQKYRNNSKKMKEIFLKQFEISKVETDKRSDMNALHPSFHAYPLPSPKHSVGIANCIENIFDANDGKVDEKKFSVGQNGGEHQSSPMINSMASNGKSGFSASSAAYEKLAVQENSFVRSNGWEMPRDFSGVNGKDMVCRRMDGDQYSSVKIGDSFPLSKKTLASWDQFSDATYHMNQMEMQMRMHGRIQEQHTSQQDSLMRDSSINQSSSEVSNNTLYKQPMNEFEEKYLNMRGINTPLQNRSVSRLLPALSFDCPGFDESAASEDGLFDFLN